MNHIEVLDGFLTAFENGQQRAYNIVQIQDAFLKLKPEYFEQWNRDLTDEVLIKLEKDGFLRHELDKGTIASLPSGTKYYYLTIEGRIFNKAGAYFMAARNEMRRGRNERRLMRGTWAAGIAGFLLFVMEVVKYFCPRK